MSRRFHQLTADSKSVRSSPYGVNRRDVVAFTAGAVLSASASSSASTLSQPEAQTAHGRVRGRARGQILSFLGIRYGADTSAYRFQAPRRPEPWSTTIEADAYGGSCPQRSDEPNQSEDCLFLNVWTRSVGAPLNRPVLVYLHGGAYATGSGSDPLYDGSVLVEKGDVVVVTVNHRLGPLGYGYFRRLGAPDSWADSGNVGQLDLILALQWIRQNIASFGGDPRNVTLFGQSGGGAKIATLMAMPAAKGLFHRAWTMSGQQVTAAGPLNATRRASTFLSALGLSQSSISQLASVPAAELKEAMVARDPILEAGPVYFGPTLDMRSLPRHPFYPDAPGQSNAIPMVLGNTKDETRGFLGRSPLHQDLTWAALPDALSTQMRIDVSPEWVVDQYRELYPEKSPSEVFFAATTASRSWRGQLIEAERRAEVVAKTWVYQLNWESPLDGGILGAPHTLDIPLVFGNTSVPGALSGDGQEAQVMASVFGETLIAFARYGDPKNASLPEWPQYSLEGRATMMMELNRHVQYDPRGAERRLFNAVPYIQPGT